MVFGMNSKPLVSVVMPAYNCQRYIESAIRSVMDQSCRDWELIVVDDLSDDSTSELVQKLSEIDDRIRLVENEINMGAAESRNRGLELSLGEYVAFLDSDDLWHPEKLEHQLQRMQESGADISYTSYSIIDENGNSCKSDYIVSGKSTFDELLKENFIGCSTVMITRKIAEKYRFTKEFYHEDYCLWLDILRDGYESAGCTEVLVDWRFLSNSRSYDKKGSAINRYKIYREHLGFSVLKSIKLMAYYTVRGIKKYMRK